MDLKKVKSRFVEIFGGDQESLCSFHSPGRVNLIGEHTDYNGGYVFPCALSFGTYGVVRKRNDNKVRFASTNFDLQVTIQTDHIVYDESHDWANYPKGVMKQLQERGFELGGFDVLYAGNIPNGAGLSSSASLELATAVILNTLFDCGLDMMEMVKLSQKAENQFIGVNCGIMDQFAVGMGKKDQAMFLDCKSLTYEYAPVQLQGAKLVIANTNKRRGLADSKYNERRSECEKAVEYLQKELTIHLLGDIDTETFETHKHLITDAVVCKRAEHVIYENRRALDAVNKLKSGDIEGFGKLMDASHRSLRDLYEVTGTELDTLVEEAWGVQGTIGSRMTGAGFGGCTVSIVKDEAVERFTKQVGENYQKRTGLQADFYIADIGDGTKQIIE